MPPRSPSEVSDNDKKNESTGPSSFKGFHTYPSFRDVKHKTADVWLQGKRADDGAEGLWRIYDKLYDFTPFLKLHPGGSDWIIETEGTDITEAYETSHLTARPSALLSKYYVREARTPRNSPYTLKDNDFYKTLKKRVAKILEHSGTGPTTEMLFIQYSLLGSYLLAAALSIVLESYTFGTIAGLFLTMTTVCAHNFFHQKHSWRIYIWDLSMLSSRQWKISHALSHHLYTNTIQDFEITMFEPYFELLPKEDKRWVARYGSWVYWPLFYGVMHHYDYIRRWCFTITGVMKLRPEHFLTVVEFILMWVLHGDFWFAFKMWNFIMMVNSISFGFVGLTAAHHHPDIFHDGDAARSDPDWGLCQLDAVRDRKESFGSLFLVAISFGDHALHHLFPTVDHSRLSQLYPVFLQTCKEFKFKYELQPYWRLILGQYAQFANATPNPIPPESPLSPVRYNKED